MVERAVGCWWTSYFCMLLSSFDQKGMESVAVHRIDETGMDVCQHIGLIREKWQFLCKDNRDIVEHRAKMCGLRANIVERFCAKFAYSLLLSSQNPWKYY